MMSKSMLAKSLGVLLIVGVLVGQGTVPATGAPPGAPPDAAPSTASGVLLFVEAEFDSPGLNGAVTIAVSVGHLLGVASSLASRSS